MSAIIPTKIIDKAKSLRNCRARIIANAVGIPFLLLMIPFSWQNTAAGNLLLLPASMLALAIAMRATENLVHELSHSNVFFKRSTNLAYGILVAAMVTISFRNYQHSHFIHHRMFGSKQDPCFNRMIYHGPVSYLQYSSEFVQTIGRAGASTLLLFAVWLLVIGGCCGAAGVFLYLFTLAVVLPVIRLNAESAEHDYSKPIFEGTGTSVGVRELLHPLGDGFHLLHHLLPYVPGTALAELHQVATKSWPKYASTIRFEKINHSGARK